MLLSLSCASHVANNFHRTQYNKYCKCIQIVLCRLKPYRESHNVKHSCYPVNKHRLSSFMTTTHRHDNNRLKHMPRRRMPHTYIYANATKWKLPAEVLNELMALRCCSSFTICSYDTQNTTLHVYLQLSNICSSSSFGLYSIDTIYGIRI